MLLAASYLPVNPLKPTTSFKTISQSMPWIDLSLGGMAISSVGSIQVMSKMRSQLFSNWGRTRGSHDSRLTYARGRCRHSLGPFGRSGPELRARGLGAREERMDSGDRRWQKRQSIAVQETKKPAQLRRASVGRGGTPTSATCYPVYIGRAVKPGVSALPLR